MQYCISVYKNTIHVGCARAIGSNLIFSLLGSDTNRFAGFSLVERLHRLILCVWIVHSSSWIRYDYDSPPKEAEKEIQPHLGKGHV